MLLSFRISWAHPLLCVSTGIRMWALNGYNLVDGYPKYIHKLGFPKTVRKVDAAVHIGETGKTLFFTDEDYWRCLYVFKTLGLFLCSKQKFKKKKKILNSVTVLLCVARSYDEAKGTMDAGYPRSIEDDFPGMDDEIDAAAYHYGTVVASNFSISSSN